MSLLSVLQYAKDTLLNATTTYDAIDWVAIQNDLVPKFFDDRIGAAAGFGPAGTGGTYSEAAKMLAAIAYSAIDEGTRVFGDVGIRAMFNDTNDIGKVVKLPDGSTTVKLAAGALSDILMQFAGSMAFRQVLMAGNAPALQGVIALDSPTAPTTLTVDLSDALWGLGGTIPANIVGKQTLTDEAFGRVGTNGFSDTRTGMKWLWGVDNSDIIDRISFAATNSGTTFTIPERAIPSPVFVTLFAAGGGADTITGSSSNDFSVGAAANDNAFHRMRQAA
jgi:hypothetical protein